MEEAETLSTKTPTSKTPELAVSEPTEPPANSEEPAIPETPRGLRVHSKSVEQTREIGQLLGGLLQAGDLIILDGSLGAGKTTFVQGVARVLDVRGRVTSPTFIVAREHRSNGERPALVHVDAYRLSDVDDLESVDLVDSLADSITFVEWGRGKVEELASERLEIEFAPVYAADDTPGCASDYTGAGDYTGECEDEYADEYEEDCEPRLLTFIPVGESWVQRVERLAELLGDYRA